MQVQHTEYTPLRVFHRFRELFHDDGFQQHAQLAAVAAYQPVVCHGLVPLVEILHELHHVTFQKVTQRDRN